MALLKKKQPAKAESWLDSYISNPPDPQNMIDIFAGEWSSKFPKECNVNAGPVPLFEDPRIYWMLGELNGIADMRVLELGPLEGAHSFILDRAGASRVLAIESNRRAFLKCLIVKELLGMPSVEFVLGDFRGYFERLPEDRFDLCVASGVLYHMKEPVELIAQIAQRCNRLFLWTHYYEEVSIRQDTNLPHRFTDVFSRVTHGYTYALRRYSYLEGLENAGFCGGNAEFSHWLTREDLFGALKHFGFRDFRVFDEQTRHKHGPSLSILAVKQAAPFAAT